MKGPYGEEILLFEKVPKSLLKQTNSYWFVDSVFKKHSFFKSLSNVTFLNAGEDLKSLKLFEKNLRILSLAGANRKTTVYCVGGGSLGDSIGFLCSVYMRGLQLVMLPTTWLAAVDSSIGGKTALNLFGYKNLIGTFYPPLKNIFVEELIESSSMPDAEGEIFKTLILNHSKKWAKELMLSWSKNKIKFSDLKYFVHYKSAVVKKDPEDTKEIRAVLNLGHSLGHALELEKGLSHGEAVKQGVLFAVNWSEHKGLLKKAKSKMFRELLNVQLSKISCSKLLSSLEKDKKGDLKSSLKFIFISDKGAVVEKVLLQKIVDEYKRQLCTTP